MKIELRPFIVLNMNLKKKKKSKYYLNSIQDAKLLINHIAFFLKRPIDTKNLTNFSHDVVD